MSLVRTLDELVPLRDEWNRLADRLRQPLLRHEWFLAAARRLHDERDLRIVVRRSGGRLTAAAPLVAGGGSLLSPLEFIGSRALGEPSGFLFEDESSLEELLREVCSLGTPLALARLAADSPERRVLRRAAGRTVVLSIETAPSLVLPLNGDWDRFLASRPQRLRYDLRRARRRAEAEGEVSVETASPRPDQVDALFDRFVGVEAAGWKGHGGTALLRRDKLRIFFGEFCRATAERDALRTAFLRIGGDLAAGALAIEACGRAWVLKIGYDQRWARCSPGLVLTGEAIADAALRGMTAYEFLGSAESWEERWVPDRRRHITVLAYPINGRGILSMASDFAGAARQRISKAFQTTPPSRRRSARIEASGRDADKAVE